MEGEGILYKTTNGDFRYYMHDGTTAFSFELAGRLSDEGARELQQAWRTASSVIGDRSLIVDLSYVTGIDVAGQNLLRGWHDRGAQLVAKSPEARARVQSITGQSVGEISAAARHLTWLPFQRVAS
jgi:anti-anti-sigma regulatory factor